MNQSLGILGGLGPLASAEFLKTIYECNLTGGLEQESPKCILYCDPTFPDRTDAILKGAEDSIVALLTRSLENLCQMGVSKIVIACITMHYFLPKVPIFLRGKVISLIDLIVEEVLNTEKTHLLLCSKGARQAGIFQKHKHWQLIEKYILLSTEEDQDILQKYIYQVKIAGPIEPIVSYLNSLFSKYEVDSLIAGCTELHVVNKYLMLSAHSAKEYYVFDPLINVAKNLSKLMAI